LYGTGVFSPEFYLSFLFYSSRLGAIASLAVIYPSKNPMGFKSVVLIKYEDRFWVRSPLSISQIFLNKKRRNLKKGETIDRYSFERRNQGGGQQKNGEMGSPRITVSWKTWLDNLVQVFRKLRKI
jgi:hypothetical protein